MRKAFSKTVALSEGRAIILTEKGVKVAVKGARLTTDPEKVAGLLSVECRDKGERRKVRKALHSVGYVSLAMLPIL